MSIILAKFWHVMTFCDPRVGCVGFKGIGNSNPMSFVRKHCQNVPH